MEKPNLETIRYEGRVQGSTYTIGIRRLCWAFHVMSLGAALNCWNLVNDLYSLEVVPMYVHFSDPPSERSLFVRGRTLGKHGRIYVDTIEWSEEYRKYENVYVAGVGWRR